MNVVKGESGKLQNLLLINDGEGHFSVDTTRFPDWLDSAFEPLCSGLSSDPQEPPGCNEFFLIAELMDTDLDGDCVYGPAGFADIAASPNGPPLEEIPRFQILQVFQNDGSGHFTEGARLPVREDRASAGERDIFPGDFNSDGWPDFIYSIENRLSCEGVGFPYWCEERVENFTVDLVLNNGDGTFRDATEQLPNRNDSSFEGVPPVVVDFNRDGALDLGYPSGTPGRYRSESLPWPAIYLNVGQGVFLDSAELIPVEASSQRGVQDR